MNSLIPFSLSDQTHRQTEDKGLAMLRETKENLSSSLTTIEQTKKVAAETMVDLHAQGKQLQRISGKLDAIDEKVKIGEQQIEKMESWWGWLKAAVKSLFDKEPTPVLTEHSPQQFPKDDNPTASATTMLVKPLPSGMSEAQKAQARIDKDLDQLLEGLGHLHQMALGISEALDEHNELLDEVNHKTLNTTNGIRQCTRRVEKVRRAL